MATALLIWPFVPVFTRIAEQEISPNALVFHRLWIASLILAIAQVIQLAVSRLFTPQDMFTHRDSDRENNTLTSRHSEQDPEAPKAIVRLSYPTVLALIGAAVFSAFTNLAWLTSLSQTTVANSALLHNFTPIFVALIGFFWLGQRFDGRFIVGVVIAISGSALLGWEDLTYKAAQLQGDGLALLSALFWAMHLLLLDYVRALSAWTVTFYCCLIGSIAAGATLLFTPTDTIYPTSSIGWLSVVALGVSIILCTALTAYSVKYLSSEFVSVTMLINPILSPIVAWVLLSETIGLYGLIAFPIILSGIYLSITSSATAVDKTLEA